MNQFFKNKKWNSQAVSFTGFRWWVLICSLLIAIEAQGQLNHIHHWSILNSSWLLYLLATLLFIWVFIPWFHENLKTAPFSHWLELTLLTLILGVAVFFRFYKLHQIPSGLFIDMGFAGRSALQILYKGWRPFYIEPLLHDFAMAYYQLAFWFMLVKPTQWGLLSFYATLSLLTLPLVYWTFRQLAGPRMALLSLLILAVMRWNINFDRNGFPSVQVPLYMFGTLAFLLHGFQYSKRWAFLVATLFFSAGFYSYQAYKAFPLLLLFYAIYEWFHQREKFKKNMLNIFLFLSLSSILLIPVAKQMIKQHALGTREAHLFILNKIQAEHSWEPLWNNLLQTALMFNWKGDPNSRHNLQKAKMLDNVSGVLLILGLGYALYRFRRRKYFYALSGLVVMTLPCILSVDAAEANRMMGVTPFLAFLIATPCIALWGRIRAPQKKFSEILYGSILLIPLSFMTYQNFQVYFHKQARSFASWDAYSINATTMGNFIQKQGMSYVYFIPPHYHNHCTIQYLGFQELKQIHLLKLPEDLAPLKTPHGKGLAFCFTQSGWPIFKLIRHYYPHASFRILRNPWNHPYIYTLWISPAQVDAARGLEGRLLNSKSWVHFQSFPKHVSFTQHPIEFKGDLYFSKWAKYFFKTSKRITLWINQTPIVTNHPYFFSQGFYSLRIQYDPPAQKNNHLHLEMRAFHHPWKSIASWRFTTLPIVHTLLATRFSNYWLDRSAHSTWIHSDQILKIVSSNKYCFQVSSSRFRELILNRKIILKFPKQKSRVIYLKSGKYFLQLYQKYWIHESSPVTIQLEKGKTRSSVKNKIHLLNRFPDHRRPLENYPITISNQ